MVSAIVDNDNNIDMALFQPNTNFMIKQQIMCVPMITKCVNGYIEVLVMNKTDQPIKLYHQSRIGNILPVSEVQEQNTVTLIQQHTSDDADDDVGQITFKTPQAYPVVQFDGGQNIVICSMIDPDKPPYICHRNRVKIFQDEWPTIPLRSITSKYSSSNFKLETNKQTTTANAVPRDTMEKTDITPIPLPDETDLCGKDDKNNSSDNIPSHRYFLRSTV